MGDLLPPTVSTCADEQEDEMWWMVLSEFGANVRRCKDIASEKIGVKENGTLVKGEPDGNWLALQEELGYILMSQNGTENLSQVAGRMASALPLDLTEFKLHDDFT